jgi:hypothetical protein
MANASYTGCCTTKSRLWVAPLLHRSCNGEILFEAVNDDAGQALDTQVERLILALGRISPGCGGLVMMICYGEL